MVVDSACSARSWRKSWDRCAIARVGGNVSRAAHTRKVCTCVVALPAAITFSATPRPKGPLPLAVLSVLITPTVSSSTLVTSTPKRSPAHTSSGRGTKARARD